MTTSTVQTPPATAMTSIPVAHPVGAAAVADAAPPYTPEKEKSAEYGTAPYPTAANYPMAGSGTYSAAAYPPAPYPTSGPGECVEELDTSRIIVDEFRMILIVQRSPFC